MKARSGFSLIELLVTVAIIAVLAAIAVPQFRVHFIKAKMAKVVNQAPYYKDKIEQYYAVNGVGPANPNALGIPGPMTTNTYQYVQRSTADLPAEDVLFGIGVYDHTIGSPKIAAIVYLFKVADLGIPQIGGMTDIELVYVMNLNNGSLTWFCVFGGGTNVYNTYLPAGCVP